LLFKRYGYGDSVVFDRYQEAFDFPGYSGVKSTHTETIGF
jgi:hypothetical protein